jgi:transcriptional regulator with XRE-family HTH domain
MVSGSKPNVARRKTIATLRARGLSLAEIGRRLGISKQCVHETLGMMTRPPAERSVTCAGCGAVIPSPGALPCDAGGAMCLACLACRPGAPFGVRLKSLRLAAGLTRAELARRAGVGPALLGRYEEGRHLPRSRQSAGLSLALSLAFLRAGA